MNLPQNIIVADSGSTKTAWMVLNGSRQEQFSTAGVNPFFRDTGDIIKEWQECRINELKHSAGKIYFYAAGVVNHNKAEIIRQALLQFFPEAEISVQSDLLAAAHATLGNKKGIACILGTGSNSCCYNGKNITAHIPPLGFILGDEGSGAVMGRQLVGDYLKKKMPSELRQSFKEKYPFPYDHFLKRVYEGEKPNRFLAEFVPFLKSNIHHDYCKLLVQDAFQLFILRNLAQYEGYKNKPAGFAGSVAWHFKQQLSNVCRTHHITIENIVKDPLFNLAEYHLK